MHRLMERPEGQRASHEFILPILKGIENFSAHSIGVLITEHLKVLLHATIARL